MNTADERRRSVDISEHFEAVIGVGNSAIVVFGDEEKINSCRKEAVSSLSVSMLPHPKSLWAGLHRKYG